MASAEGGGSKTEILGSDETTVADVITDGFGVHRLAVTTEGSSVGTVDQGNPNTTANAWPVKVTDGTNVAAVAPASTPPAATDPALVVAISPNSSISVTATNPSVGTNNAAAPGSSTQIGGSDGTDLQASRIFDLDTGAGTEFVLGASIRLPGNGGSVPGGIAANPLRVDPTGTTTQPISATSLPLPTNAAQETGGNLDAIKADVDSLAAHQTDGTQKTIVRGGTKGVTTPADITSTTEGADHQALDVQIYHGSSTIDPRQIRALSSGTDSVTVTGTVSVGTPTVDQGAPNSLANAWPVEVTDGANVLGTAAHPIRIDPTGTTTQPISAVSLPLPANAAQETGGNLDAIKADTDSIATHQTDGTQKSIVRGGAKGATVAADVTSTSEGADHQALDVQIYHGGSAINPTQIRALTASDVVTAQQGGAPWTQDLIRINGTTVVTLTPGEQQVGVEGLAATGAATVGNPVLVGGKDGSGNVEPIRTATDGTVRIDPTGTTTQPVSGTVTANQGGAPWSQNLTQIAGSAVTTQAAGELKVAVEGTAADNSALSGNPVRVGASDGTNIQTPRVFDGDTGGGTQFVLGVSLRKSASGGTVEAGTPSDPLRVDPTGTTTQPVSTTQLPAALVGGRLDTNVGAWIGSTAPTVGQKTMAASVPVVIASDQSAVSVSPTKPASSAVTRVASSASNVNLLVSNANRLGAMIYNESNKTLYVKFGTTAATNDYTVQISPNGFFEVPFGYTGNVDGIWAAANGAAQVTELS
jgi:hypothetical protein